MRRARVLLLLVAGCDERGEQPAPTCVDWLSCYDTCAHDYAEASKELPGIEQLESCRDACEERTGYTIRSGPLLSLPINQGGIHEGAVDGTPAGAERFHVVLELRAQCHEDALGEGD